VFELPAQSGAHVGGGRMVIVLEPGAVLRLRIQPRGASPEIGLQPAVRVPG
jgi:hypothetical protein